MTSQPQSGSLASGSGRTKRRPARLAGDAELAELNAQSAVFGSEEWAWVPSYEGRYAVSTQGRVVSFARGSARSLSLKPEWPGVVGHGYIKVKLSAGNARYRSFGVHQLVARAFLGPSNGSDLVAHINNDTTDNRVENLMWGDHKINYEHSRLAGTAPIGERHGRYKCRA